MSVFRELRSKAGLTVSEASTLLQLELDRIVAYENGESTPTPREIQALKGMALLTQSLGSTPGSKSDVIEVRQARRERAATAKRSRGDGLKKAMTASAELAPDRADADEVHTGRILEEIRSASGMTPTEISRVLGASLVSVVRWARGDNQPGPDMVASVLALHRAVMSGEHPTSGRARKAHTFASRGARASAQSLPLFDSRIEVPLTAAVQGRLIQRLKPSSFWGNGEGAVASLLESLDGPAPTVSKPTPIGVSAGKNTYTYDAHTYHTKVPPQGIAEILAQYLPDGGLVLDPFAGSGMTGVASRALGYDVILNELSPAASFIADRFILAIDPNLFAAAVRAVVQSLDPLRQELYQTRCRQCGKSTEIQYTVWSYRVVCPSCEHEFILWDHCRKYGRTVREHKILSEFPCPCCKTTVKKSRLARTYAVPVLLGYKCCRRVQVEHPLDNDDLARIERIEDQPNLAEGFFPTTQLPDGVNLCQPKRHGLTSVDRFYTKRNLSAMSHLWRAIHRIEDAQLAGFVAFAFTSLYQRVTRLSEFRFWGGSGNTANFNVPYIFNEANVLVTFERKARTIQDHLETTASHYRSRCVVRTGSATDLSFLPSESVDLIFTDPPFGANINYSEMNILWEAWLGAFTDARDEAIVNRFQGKDANGYGELMRASLQECYRVLRPGHWLLLVFMNSSEEIWQQLRRAILAAGFSLERIDIFDKQHGTFKQFVSENTAGSDLVLHCKKEGAAETLVPCSDVGAEEKGVRDFLKERKGRVPKLPYLHVNRAEEIDYRMLYSEWLAVGLMAGERLVDFASFRRVASAFLGAQNER